MIAIHIPVLAIIVSLFSLSLSIYVTTVSRATTRAETFRLLRYAFFEFRQKLPHGWWAAETLPDSQEDLNYMIRYWQYAFDEWFIITQLNPHVLKPLWTKYYERAIASTSCNGPMLVALFSAFRACNTPTDQKFLDEILNKMATPEAKQLAVELANKHDIPIPTGFGLDKY